MIEGDQIRIAGRTYTIGSQLGRGGWGLVHRAVCEGETLAVKCFAPPADLADQKGMDIIDDMKARFIREVIVQSNFQDGNIVPIIGYDIKLDNPLYVMPEANSTLAKDIERGLVKIENLPQIISDILAGLDALHQQSTYHRDLKPQNILRFGKSTSASTYKISDFGLISMQAMKSRLTQAGFQKLDDSYTAPEIAQDLQNATASADLFSLACIIHDVVSEKARVVGNQIDEDNIEYSKLLKSATSKTYRYRPQTVQEFRERFDRANASKMSKISSPRDETLLKRIFSGDAKDPSSWKRYNDLLSEADPELMTILMLSLTTRSVKVGFEANPEVAFELSGEYIKWASQVKIADSQADTIINVLSEFIRWGTDELKAKAEIAKLFLASRSQRPYAVDQVISSWGQRTMPPSLVDAIVRQIADSCDKICPAIATLEDETEFERSSINTTLRKAIDEHCG
jgi:eukaryotic-like serine/threonine-protein kinase